MKRSIAVGSAIAAATLFVGLVLAAARPDWLPAGVRARLPLQAGAGGPGAAAEDAGLFCKEHGVPEKFCTICHEELKAKLMLCKEHGDIPEDICTLCHPEVEKKHRLEMCPKGHGLPREFCSKCGKGPSASTAEPDDGWCATHGKPEDLCGDCLLDPKAHDAPRPDGKVCRQPLPTVRLASAKLAEQVGIRTEAAAEERHAHTLAANAETAYDGNRYADITPRVAGFLSEVRADLGQVVGPGEVLAVVDSAEVGAVKAQYIASKAAEGLARATYDRTRPMAREGLMPRKDEVETLTALNRAKAALLEATQRLRNFGFDDARLGRILLDDETASTMDVASPLGGTVVARHAVRGEPVEAATQVFAVTDTGSLWLWVDVYEPDVAAVKVGQAVAFRASGSDETFEGRVNWVGTEVNPQTRTTRVRAELANPGGKLRANQFGQAEVRVGEEHRAVVVPKAAVQRKDGVDVVFLPQAEGGTYRPQRVVARPADRGDALEVAWGLRPGQRVVTKGAFLLKTEIMKGAIGAGCCK